MYCSYAHNSIQGSLSLNLPAPPEHVLIIIMILTLHSGESKTLQRGKVTANVWMDNKLVTVISTNTQPSATGSVLHRQKDGTRTSIPCPESVISYNSNMGGVDRGDQLRGYYNCRTKRYSTAAVIKKSTPLVEVVT